MIQKYLAGSLSVERLSIPIANLSPKLVGTKIVHLTDFHFDGIRLSEQLLQQAIATSNQFQPDLVLLTGDYVTDQPAPITQLAAHLAQLQTQAGIFAVLGNHDLLKRDSQAQITQALTEQGIQVLWNQVSYPLGQDLAIVGLPDYWSRQFQPELTLSQIDPQIPRIVLSHNPDSAEDLMAWRVDLQLSGHTHGGQVVIPGVGPVIGKIKQWRSKIPKKMKRWVPFLWQECYEVVQNWEWSQGLHRIGNNRVYINRGLGTYMPGRFFCPPELTLIELTGN
ncbi:MAG: metallophosphoesterase [Pseudanabaenaceae cyanobacterium bins.68]|nr:metallophosphoesterase [Pseudanabaenaceae cyanobacterium bins.68]